VIEYEAELVHVVFMKFEHGRISFSESLRLTFHHSNEQSNRRKTIMSRKLTFRLLKLISMFAFSFFFFSFSPHASAATVSSSSADVAQATLTIANTTLTANVGAAVGLTTSGGSGTGAITYSVTGTGCTVPGSSLIVTAAGTCVVTATKAASTGFLAATSAPVSFSISDVIQAVAQATLTIANTTLTANVGAVVPLTTSGGSGTGAITYSVTGTGCSGNGSNLRASRPTTCVVTATKAASTGFLDATSAPVTFTSR